METTFTTEPVPPDASLLEAAEALLSKTPAPSPFALSDDHEFKLAQAPKPQVEPVSVSTSRSPAQIATGWRSAKPNAAFVGAIPLVPSPGSPDSPYRKCSCLAVMPGRTCNRCLGSKWVKPCPKCEGQGRTDMSRRKGSGRSQPCGFCMATGQVSAGKAEITKAEELARIAAAAPIVMDSEAPIPAFRRAARLPLIGSPEKKRKGRPGRRAKKTAEK